MALAWNTSFIEQIPPSEPRVDIIQRLIELQGTTDVYIHPRLMSFRDTAHRTNWSPTYPFILDAPRSDYAIFSSLWRAGPAANNVWIGICGTPNSTFVGLSSEMPIVWHAWAFALIKDHTGKRHILIYSSGPYDSHDGLNGIMRYIVQLTRRSGHIGRRDAAGHSAFLSSDETFRGASLCLRLSIHWIRFIASFGDKPLVDNDLRLQGFKQINR